MQVVRYNGKSRNVYSVIAPLAMDPEIIRKRHNLPIKTDETYTWHVLKEGTEVKAFVGQEALSSYTKLQAFVVLNATEKELLKFLKEVVDHFGKTQSPKLTVSVLNEYATLFEKAGFQITGYKTNWTDLAIVKT